MLSSLPAIETEAESRRRTTDEVAWRALALAAVAVKGEGHGEAKSAEVMAYSRQLVDEFELDSVFTPAERRFIDDAQPTDHDRVQFTWRYECFWTLLWALGFVEVLDPPAHICDPATAMRIMRTLGKTGFLDQALLRPQAELLDEADLIYRYDWAVVNARLKGHTVKGLDAGWWSSATTP